MCLWLFIMAIIKYAQSVGEYLASTGDNYEKLHLRYNGAQKVIDKDSLRFK